MKKVLFAIAALVLMASSVRADDGLLSGFNLNGIADAQIEIEDGSLDLDVDGLAAEAEGEESNDAIEACFRRFGYRSYGGYRYGGCYRPYYSHYSYCTPSYYCYRPVYHHTYRVAPVYTYSYYWGCY